MEEHEHRFDYVPDSKRILCKCGQEQPTEEYTLETLQKLKDRDSFGCLLYLILYFAFMAYVGK